MHAAPCAHPNPTTLVQGTRSKWCRKCGAVYARGKWHHPTKPRAKKAAHHVAHAPHAGKKKRSPAQRAATARMLAAAKARRAKAR